MPTPEEVYEYTLDGLYEGEDSGRTEAPTGWFAKVLWPDDGLWYLVQQDDRGFKYLPVQGADKATVDAAYAALEDEYADWDSQDEDS